MDSIKLVLFGCVLLWMCLYAIYRGFVFLKQKRVIEDTPTSNIATAAIGNSVEVKGRCIPLNEKKSIHSPLLNQSCIGYTWIIEEHKQRGKKAKWVETGRFYSDQYLKIKDKSGKSVLVRFDELNFEFWRTKKRVNLKSFFSKNHQGIVNVVERYSELSDYIRHKEFLGAFRVTEYSILPFHNIYLLGEASGSGEIEDLSRDTPKKKIIYGDESDLESYRHDQNDVQFSMKKSLRFGDILKIDKVFISNFKEQELIKKIALKAYALIFFGILGFAGTIFFLSKYLLITLKFF